MKKLLAVIIFLATPLLGQSNHPPYRTVGALGSCSDGSPKLVYVTDGNAADDCSTGTGTTEVLCGCQDGSWTAAGGGGGGSTPGGSSTEIQYRGGASTFSGDANFIFTDGTPDGVFLNGIFGFGALVAASATCIDDDTDRLYGDKDCDGTKDAGEEWLDGAGGTFDTLDNDYGAETITSAWDASGADWELPNGTTPTGTDCDAAGEAGRVWIDTDATSGEQWFVCEGTSGWVLQGGGGGGGYSPILDTKGTADDPPDDEFSVGTLDGNWTAVSGSTGTVNILETGDVSEYDLSTRSGWMLMQVGNDASSRIVELRQDYTLATGKSIILAMSPSWDAHGATSSAGEHRMGFSLNDSDVGYDSTEGMIIWLEMSSSINHRVTAWNGSSYVGQINYAPTGEVIYLRIDRATLNYYAFFSSDGTSWVPVGAMAMSTEANNLWLFAENFAASSGTIVPIQAFDWIRLGDGGYDPW